MTHSFFFKALFFIVAISPLSAAHFENLVDLTIKVEDPSYNVSIKSMKFNNQEVKLDEPDMFKPRKELNLKLPPGHYPLVWIVEKGGGKWSDTKPTTIEKILVLESGDTVVKINIKGETVNLY